MSTFRGVVCSALNKTFPAAIDALTLSDVPKQEVERMYVGDGLVADYSR